MGLFRSKKQIDKAKAIPLDKNLSVTTELKLAELSLNFSASLVGPYYARIVYKEKPDQWQEENNQSKRVEIKATSWPELVDKVLEHFQKEES